MISTSRAYRVSRIASKLISVCAGVGLMAAIGCSQGDAQLGEPAEDVQFDEVGAALTQTSTVSLKLPAAVELYQVSVAARDTLTLNDRVRIEGMATAATTSSGKIQSGTWTNLRELVSGGQVILGNDAEVNGDIRAGGSVTKPTSAEVNGTITQNTPLGPNQTVSWSYTWDSASQGNVVVNANQQQVLAPGTYGTLNLNSQGHLRLRSGVYVFGNMTINAASKVIVDDSAGPVQIYGTGTFNYQGAITGATSGLPRLVVGLTTTSAVTVSAPFTGVLVAPNATVNLQAATPQGHRAVFYGKNLTAQPDVIVRAYPFDWSTLIPSVLPPLDPNAATHPMPRSALDEPINVNRLGSGSGGETPGDTTRIIDSPSPITFTLPEKQAVQGGNLGNGTVVFTFSGSGGSPVTCTYVGGAGTAQPATKQELNGGRYMNFVSCSDGSLPGSSQTATHFEVTVNSVPGYPVIVSAPVIQDGACSDSLELFTAEETALLRDTFSWSNATTVAENNPDGTPALYYAYVYLSNANDAVNLRKLRIHALNRPLFETELSRFDGKCGALANPGDGDGTFIHAVIPGLVYNRLLAALSAPNLSGNREVFEAVVLRPPPLEARNPNNSIRYDVLAQSRFRYLSYESFPLASASSITQYAGADPIAALVDVIDFIGQGVDLVVDGINRGIGAIALVFADSIVVTFNVRGVVPDTAFASPVMVRGWGPLSNQPLAAPGLKVTLIQSLLGPIPMTFEARTNMVGSATIEAVRQSGSAGLCVELKNEAAMVTDFLWAREICDFRPSSPNHALARLNDFDGRQVNAEISESSLVGLYQADDAFRWARDVTGFTSRRGTLMTGMFANTFSPDSGERKRLYAPCLGYTNIGSEFVGATMAAGGLLGFLASASGTGLGPAVQAVALTAATIEEVLGRTDVMMSSVSSLRDSRMVMTHEYGHFLFCGMLNQAHPLAVEKLVWSVMTNLEDQSAGYTYMNEAFADFVAGQVVGGANYSWLRDSVTGLAVNGPGEALCNNLTNTCFDVNLNQLATNQLDDSRSIGRIATMLFDAFDGRPSTKLLAVPNNADSWQSTPPGPGGLVFSPVSYGSTDGAIETVQLSGSRLVDFAAGIAQAMTVAPSGNIITDVGIYGSLNQAMVNDGVASWCDRCRVLGLHSPQRGVVDTDIGGLFHTCTVDAVVRDALGGLPPQAEGRIGASTCQACPAGHISDATGTCVPCVGTVVGNSCMTCAVDAVIDANTLDRATLDPSTPTPNDACPTVFWVRLDNPSAVFGRGAQSISAMTTPLGVFSIFEDSVLGTFSQSLCERPFELNLGHLEPTGPTIDTGINTTGVYSPCEPSETDVCLDSCQPIPRFDFLEPAVAGTPSLYFALPADASTRFMFASFDPDGTTR